MDLTDDREILRYLDDTKQFCSTRLLFASFFGSFDNKFFLITLFGYKMRLLFAYKMVTIHCVIKSNGPSNKVMRHVKGVKNQKIEKQMDVISGSSEAKFNRRTKIFMKTLRRDQRHKVCYCNCHKRNDNN